VLSKTYVFASSFAGIVGSNLAEGMDVRVMSLLCCVSAAAFGMGRSLLQRNPMRSVCVILFDIETSK